MARAIVVIVDSADRAHMERLMAEGRLPHLAALRDGGVIASLEGPQPYRSELAWARFLGGREPLDGPDWPTATTFDPATYDVGMDSASSWRPFFAFDDGTPVVAFDLIHSAPSPDVKGVQVVGWGSHSAQWPPTSLPAGMLDTIDERFGPNPAFKEDQHGWHNAAYLQTMADLNVRSLAVRGEVAEWLVEAQPDWQLLVSCVSELHNLGHHAWFGVDPAHPLHGVAATTTVAAEGMDQVAVAADEYVGRLLALGDGATSVLVAALHGFAPADDVPATVLVPELFHRHHFGRRAGLLREVGQRRWRRQGCPPVLPRPDQRADDWLRGRFADNPAERARRLARRLGLRRRDRPIVAGPPDLALPREVHAVDDDALAAASVAPRYQLPYRYRHRWPAMRFFATPSFGDAHVRVNVAGREASGVVAPADYDRVLDEIESLVRACGDGRTGAPVVAEVMRMRSDPFDPTGPDADLLVRFTGAHDSFQHPSLGLIGPFPHQRTASHNNLGFVIGHGPGIGAASGDLGTRPVVDLPPTVLALLGRDQSEGMPGRSLVG